MWCVNASAVGEQRRKRQREGEGRNKKKEKKKREIITMWFACGDTRGDEKGGMGKRKRAQAFLHPLLHQSPRTGDAKFLHKHS